MWVEGCGMGFEDWICRMFGDLDLFYKCLLLVKWFRKGFVIGGK